LGISIIPKTDEGFDVE
jgi:hypothetical protein